MGQADCVGCRQRDVVIAQLQERIAALELRAGQQDQRIGELEGRLKTNSSNSSLPPSANPPSAPPPVAKAPTGRKIGGQVGHPGHGRLRLPPQRVDEVIAHVPQRCRHCQAPLPAQAGPHDPEPTWHQVVELPAVLVRVTEHQGQARTCPQCGKITWAPIPAPVLAHGLGPNLTATLAYLSGAAHVSKRMVQQIAQTVLGVPLALGSVSHAEAEMAAALAEPYAQAEEAVQKAPVKNSDETGWSLAGRLCWLWLAASRSVALFKVCAGRGRQALGQLLGGVIRGVVSSDRWGAYGMVDLSRRQLCWAHLKRDFQKWVDWGGEAQAIGQAGLAAVDRVFALWREYRPGGLDRPPPELGKALAPVAVELYGALETGLACPNQKAARFCRNVLDVYPALWTFAHAEGLEPTNNHAERTLRPAVLWRKISFGNHSPAGCRFVERILTTVQTLKLQQRPALAYLRRALTAYRAGEPAPALVLEGV